MITYYAFSKCEFYRKKFAGYVRLDKNLDISKLPIVMRSEAKEAFLSGDIISNYFDEDYGIFRTSSCGRDAFLYARSLQTKRFSRMAVAFLNTGKWKINEPWFKLTALNCLDTVHPLGIKASSEITDDLEKGNAVIIPPSENFIDAPTADIKEIYHLIRNSDINLFHANPTYLKLLLYRFRKEGLRLNNHYAVNSTYETLLPSTGRLIKKYLDCEVYDQYGCSETGPISFTCKQGNHHIFSDSVYVEIIPSEDLGRDDIGRIVVTDLENKIMPFVKYFTGDFAYVIGKQECSCDLHTPLMGRIIGREDEMINYKGKIIFPLEIDNVFSDLDNILMYQVIFQAGQFIIKIVPESKSRRVSKEEIRNRLIRYFDDKKCPIQIILVESILPSRRGKYRTVIVK
jgi:phenylacetate-coenzyme A ligase PaaK-like adenylate-forming protein